MAVTLHQLLKKGDIAGIKAMATRRKPEAAQAEGAKRSAT